MYLQCGSACSDGTTVKAWTNCTNYNDQACSGIALVLRRPEKGISLPFSGYLRFEIPEEGQVDDNAGLCIEINTDACIINQILLNNAYEKPVILSVDTLRFGCSDDSLSQGLDSLFPISAASIVLPEPSNKDRNLSFSFSALQEDEYLLFYRNWGEHEYLKENICEIFVPKKHYLPNEALTVSYRNVYDFELENKHATNIMFYKEDDVPGKTPSQEYVILKWYSFSRSSSGTVVIPRDGVRFLAENASGRYACGKYCMRLLQAYRPLCPEQDIVITNNIGETWLNLPQPAGVFYIKGTNVLNKVVFTDVSPEQLTCIRFTCKSPIVDVFEQSLHYVPHLQKYVANVKEHEPLPESVLNSLMNFILHGIYIESIHEMRSKIDKKHAGLNCHKLVSYIEENICNNITIQMLCKKFYCSESYLSHLFKKHMHISVATYIYRAKMAKAKNWLSQDEKSISEIAELLQYSDVHSFSRSFKKMIGISPSEYRRLQQK